MARELYRINVWLRPPEEAQRIGIPAEGLVFTQKHNGPGPWQTGKEIFDEDYIHLRDDRVFTRNWVALVEPVEDVLPSKFAGYSNEEQITQSVKVHDIGGYHSAILDMNINSTSLTNGCFTPITEGKLVCVGGGFYVPERYDYKVKEDTFEESTPYVFRCHAGRVDFSYTQPKKDVSEDLPNPPKHKRRKQRDE